MDATKLLGDLPLAQAVHELKTMGDLHAASELEHLIADPSTADSATTLLFASAATTAWKHKSAAFGYVATDGTLTAASKIAPDATLKKQTVIIKFDGFFVRDYPGMGEHEIAIQWTAIHFEQVSAQTNQAKSISFTQKYSVRDGQGSPDVGPPIFYGLRVPDAGIGLTMQVVYVKNVSAHNVLAFMDSPEFAEGLKLITAVNPALGPLTTMAKGLISGVLTNNDGRVLHEPFLGLDFDATAAAGARLKPGSYVILQTPTPEFAWADWTLKNGVLVHKDGLPMPYDYYLLRVEREAP